MSQNSKTSIEIESPGNDLVEVDKKPKALERADDQRSNQIAILQVRIFELEKTHKETCSALAAANNQLLHVNEEIELLRERHAREIATRDKALSKMSQNIRRAEREIESLNNTIQRGIKELGMIARIARSEFLKENLLKKEIKNSYTSLRNEFSHYKEMHNANNCIIPFRLKKSLQRVFKIGTNSK